MSFLNLAKLLLEICDDKENYIERKNNIKEERIKRRILRDTSNPLK